MLAFSLVRISYIPEAPFFHRYKNGEHKRFKEFIEQYPTALSCYRIVGQACYMVMLTVNRLEEIEEFINDVSAFATTLTHIIFSEVKIKNDLEAHTPLLQSDEK